MSRGYIPAEEAAYIYLLLSHADPENKKNGLQRLCQLYRSGHIFQYPHSIRQLLNGLVHNPSLKVRRWALNAIGLMGRRVENLEAVLDAVEHGRGEPEIVISAIPALFALCAERECLSLLGHRKIPLEGAILLAAAQRSEAHRAEAAKRRVNIEKADPLQLRMATLLVGMEKAPEHLFDAKHPNKTVIGVLNTHDNNLVSQYSVWAIVENKKLGLSDLRISLKDVEMQSPNVRGWVYRLVVADDELAADHFDHIVMGSADPEEEVRDGLATALRGVYCDGLEGITLDWAADERALRIRQRLHEHMAAGAIKCPSYEDAALRVYREGDAFTRTLLEGAAQGTATYAKFRRIAITNEQTSLNLDEYREVNITMVNQNINTGGGSIGVVSGEGQVIGNSITAVNSLDEASALKPILSTVLAFIEKQVIAPNAKRAGAELVTKAAKEPSKSNLARVVGWLKSLKDGVTYTAQGAHAVGDIIHQLEALSGP